MKATTTYRFFRMFSSSCCKPLLLTCSFLILCVKEELCAIGISCCMKTTTALVADRHRAARRRARTAFLRKIGYIGCPWTVRAYAGLRGKLVVLPVSLRFAFPLLFNLAPLLTHSFVFLPFLLAQMRRR